MGSNKVKNGGRLYKPFVHQSINIVSFNLLPFNLAWRCLSNWFLQNLGTFFAEIQQLNLTLKWRWNKILVMPNIVTTIIFFIFHVSISLLSFCHSLIVYSVFSIWIDDGKGIKKTTTYG